MALLAIEDLTVAYRSPAGPVRAVDHARLSLEPASLLGLVGESGCGKTTLARAVMGVLPQGARIESGRILFDGTDLVALSARQRRARRWRDIAFVPQSAMNSFDPVWRLRAQMREVLRGRGGLSRTETATRATELFMMVGLDPQRLADFPHQFSGGMRQRAAIALALALQPRLVIADEPVTALDVIVQRQVLETFQGLAERLSLAAIVVTHDVSVVAFLCDAVAVMYAGEVIESGPTRAVLGAPLHPYTMGLINAFPSVEADNHILTPIRGAPPDLLTPPPGCRFAPRCPFAEARCVTTRPLRHVDTPTHSALCHRASEAPLLATHARESATWTR